MAYRTLLIGSIGLLTLSACGSDADTEPSQPDTVPTTPAELTPKARLHIEQTLEGFANTSANVDQAGNLSLALDSTSSCPDATTEDLDFATADLNEALTDLSHFMRDHIFVDEFVESENGETVTYRLDPETTCDGNSDCTEQLTDHPVRFISTVRSDDSVLVRVTVDSEPVGEFTMSDSYLNATLNLAEVLDVLQKISADGDASELPESLSGVIGLSLTKHSDTHFSLAYSVHEPVHAVVLDDGAPVTFDMAAAESAFTLSLDSENQEMTLSQDWNAFDIRLPGSTLCGEDSDCGEQERNGEFHYHLAGLSGSVTATGGARDELSINNLGWGDGTTFFSLNGQNLATVDINPNDGRRFNLHLRDEGDAVVATFEPKLDFKLALMLSHLSDSLKVDLPDWLMDEVFDVTFGGDAQASIRIPKDDCASEPSPEPNNSQGLEVVEGTLTLSSTSGGVLVANAGECVSEANVDMNGDMDSDAEHPFDALEVGLCVPTR